MIRFLGDFRLLPVVLFAAGCLFALKVIGLVTEGGYTLGAGHLTKTDRDAKLAIRTAQAPLLASPPAAKQSWAQEMFNYPDVTGSVDTTKSAAKPAEAADKPAEKSDDKEAGKKEKPADQKPDKRQPAVTTTAPVDVTLQLSPAERAILQRLNERRQELDARARELDMRETLLKASEQKLEARLGELKEQEARITEATKKKEEAELARLKGLVTIYESMKAKDAAKIFDRLDMKVLMEVASQINPRRMSDILGQMTPEAAERLTIEMANRVGSAAKAAPGTPAAPELPKIEGRPSGT
jgi:flagellar motility protein MotE (MotC chaperone)